MDELMIDTARLQALLDHITENPESHDQGLWALRNKDIGEGCKTAYCAAGWTVALDDQCDIKWRRDGLTLNRDIGEYATNAQGVERHISDLARNLLGFTPMQANLFFDAGNSLRRLWGYANTWTNGKVKRSDDEVITEPRN